MNESMCGLYPLISPDCRVLILGSYPSRISLQKSEYYANPRNMFWEIIAHLFNISQKLPYQKRITLLLASGVGLWDVYQSCERPNSADAEIRSPVPNDLKTLITSHQHLKAIFLNGREAEKGFRQFFPDIILDAYYLPSSSPAHAISLHKKIDYWRAITSYLNSI